jgi:hypothetical protein
MDGIGGAAAIALGSAEEAARSGVAVGPAPAPDFLLPSNQSNMSFLAIALAPWKARVSNPCAKR